MHSATTCFAHCHWSNSLAYSVELEMTWNMLISLEKWSQRSDQQSLFSWSIHYSLSALPWLCSLFPRYSTGVAEYITTCKKASSIILQESSKHDKEFLPFLWKTFLLLYYHILLWIESVMQVLSLKYHLP